jgi:hypothetical protein
MPIFISYSHEDRIFIDRLAAQLVAHKAKVWLDRWELHVGDSLIKRIQDAIAGASALLVILSKASIKSEWCNKELSAGLVRELEEKRVVVLPVLKEDCEIPLFLRDKLYADFRRSFDDGLRIILESIAKVTSNTLGRYDEPKFHIDWSIDWGTVEDSLCIRLTLVEHTVDQPYSVLTEISIIADEAATSWHIDQVTKGLREYSHYEVVSILQREFHEKRDLRLTLDDEMPQLIRGNLKCNNPERIYEVRLTSRRLGQDTGRDILLDIGGQIAVVRKTLHDVNKPMSIMWNDTVKTKGSEWSKK